MHPIVERLPTPEGNLACRKWVSTEEKSVLVYLHGIESHSGWFVETGNLLSEDGYSIYALDRLGSGLSEGARGHINSHNTWVEHVNLLIEHIEFEKKGRKIYLVGVCWGAKLAVHCAIRLAGGISGLILISPGLKTKIDLTWKEKLSLGSALILNKNKMFKIPISREQMFTSKEPYLSFIKEDPLRLKYVSSSFLFESFKVDLFNSRFISSIKVPVLVVLAGKDEIVNNLGTKKMLYKIPSSRLMIRVYPQAHHSLEFEEDRFDLVHQIDSWISTQEPYPLNTKVRGFEIDQASTP